MTEIEAEQQMSRSEVADYLREFADQLDTSRIASEGISRDEDEDDPRVTFMIGNDSATINPPETVQFEVSVESESSIIGESGEQEVEFELAWETEAAEEREGEEELEIK